MADWDPMSDSPPAEGGSTNGMGAPGDDDLLPIGGSEAKVRRRDMNRTLTDLSRKFARDAPWEAKPEPRPDLSWHKPTCTFEDWRHKDVRVELGPGICQVTLARPDENNALTEGVTAALCDALFLLHSRRDIRVAVFSGEGKMLCAGRDPKGDPYGFSVKASGADVPEALQSEAQQALAGGAFPDGKVNTGRLLQAKLWHTWATLPQFTICLANGSALGDGMGCLVCCDMAIALRTAFFGFSDTKLGLVNAGISPYLLAKTSPGAAKNMFVLGQILSAEMACEKGIVNQVVDSLAEGHKVIKEMCEEVSRCGPRSVQLAKELVLGVAGRQVTEPIMFYTLSVMARATASEEARQSAEASAAGVPRPWEAAPLVPLH